MDSLMPNKGRFHPVSSLGPAVSTKFVGTEICPVLSKVMVTMKKGFKSNWGQMGQTLKQQTWLYKLKNEAENNLLLQHYVIP